MILALFAVALADPVALDDVLASVDAGHPLLDAERAKLDLAEADRLAANGGFDPSLTAGAMHSPGEHDIQTVGVKTPLGTAWGGDVAVGWKRGVGEFEPYEGAAKTGDRGEWTVKADIPLLRDAWIDGRRASLTQARQGVVAAGFEIEQRRLDLLRAAGTRWVEWVAAGRKLAIARRIEEVAAERDRRFAALETLGEASAFTRLDNQRLLIERQERRVLAERAFERASIELSVWYRDAGGRPLAPAEADLPPGFEPPADELPSEEALREIALVRRPELARFAVQLDQLAVERRLQATRVLPGFDLVGGADVPLDPDGKTSLELGVAADWPLAARVARGRTEAVDARTRRVEEERRFAVDRVVADTQDARSAWLAARARLEATDRLVDVARQVEDGERARFDLGDSNLIFVNQRELATAEAEERRVDAVAATWTSWLDVLRATADPRLAGVAPDVQ